MGENKGYLIIKFNYTFKSSSELYELLESVEDLELQEIDARHVQLIRQIFERTIKIPKDLAIALARLAPKSHEAWVLARQDDNFSSFKPILCEMVALSRQKGAALAEGKDYSNYDALLQEYEPEGSSAAITKMFNELRAPLVDLRTAVMQKPKPPKLTQVFDEDKQIEIAHILARAFGYDFSRGRIDKAVHPFSSGSSSDVRITTRTVKTDPMNCFYSTIHEVGHGSYEQNILADYAFSALGRGCSMGMHESQSRV